MATRKQTTNGRMVAVVAAATLVPKEIWIGLRFVIAGVRSCDLMPNDKLHSRSGSNSELKRVKETEPSLAQLVTTTDSPFVQRRQSSGPSPVSMRGRNNNDLSTNL